jgi:hypothetical protein
MSNKRIKMNERIKVVKRLRVYRDPRTRTERHAIAFIKYLEILSDYCPRSDMKVLPFETVKQVYEEYKKYCDSPLNTSKINADKTIFYEVFNGLNDTVKLAGVKKGNRFIYFNCLLLFDNRN